MPFIATKTNKPITDATAKALKEAYASAIELLPTGVLTMRAAAGSEDVYCVVVPTFLASILSFLSAVLLCRLLCSAFPETGRRSRKRREFAA